MVEVTTDRLSSADNTKTKLVDCAVQVVVKTANKSVNAHQEFANFRYDKQTQVTDDNNCLSVEEEAKFERDGRELGWFIDQYNLHNYKVKLLQPNWHLTEYTRKIIKAKLHARNYTRSNGCGTKLLAKEYAKSATEHERDMCNKFWEECECYYRKDSNGKRYRTEKDEVIEVINEEELKDRLSSCINYTEEFMRVLNAKRTLKFQ